MEYGARSFCFDLLNCFNYVSKTYKTVYQLSLIRVLGYTHCQSTPSLSTAFSSLTSTEATNGPDRLALERYSWKTNISSIEIVKVDRILTEMAIQSSKILRQSSGQIDAVQRARRLEKSV